MDFWNVARITIVRWYVSLPILAAAVAFGVMTGNQVPPKYMATSSVLIVGPSVALDRQTGEMFEQNPYLTLGGAIGPMTPVLRNALDAEPRRMELAEEGIDGFEILTEAPMLHFEVTGEDPDAVLATAKELLVIADQELVDIQGYDSSYPIEQRVSAQPVVDPVSVVEDGDGAIVVIGVAGAAGLLLAVTAALITDALVTIRRRRKHLAARSAAHQASSTEAVDDEAPVPSGGRAEPAPADPARPTDPPRDGEPADPVPEPRTPAPANHPTPENVAAPAKSAKDRDEARAPVSSP